MSAGERMETVLVSMAVLSKNGIELDQSANDYYNAIYGEIRSHPDLYNVSVTNILANYLYEHDPKLRGLLGRFKKKPEIKKIERL